MMSYSTSKNHNSVRPSARRALRATASALALGMLAQPTMVLAQDDEEKDIIVVTGTLVRGIAPAGTNVVDVTAEDVEATGAATTSELLTSVPQFAAFNDFNTLSGGGNFVTTNRPNLRNLPGFTTTGTAATLLMVDGHRITGMGISSTTPDADFVPTAIIERVDIVPDGGSALYGSDAVAGVVNFITRKRFDGVEAGFRYGIGKDDYNTINADVTAGKDWGDGGLYVSYSYTETDQVFGGDKDYVFTPLSNVNGLNIQDIACPSANIQVDANVQDPTNPIILYSALDPAAANTVNACDLTDEAGIYPDQKRHSVYAGLNQQLNDWLEVDVRAYYYRKESNFSLGQHNDSVRIGPSFLASFGFVSSPFDVNLTGSPLETKTVNFALGPNNLSNQSVTIDSWGVHPEFIADLGGGWRARALMGYSESKSTSITSRLVPDATLLGLVATGAFNPFDPSNANAATIAALTDYETFGQTYQNQFDARIIVDGDLFELPGGAVKLAVGAEYIEEDYDTRKGDTVPANRFQIPEFKLGRNVKSVFGEIVAPIFETDSGMSLVVSANGRYDDYSDVGDTFNPKFGATFKPVDWVSIRGAWGESFVAPSLADNIVASPTTLTFASGPIFNFLLPTANLVANGFPAPTPQETAYINLLGSSPNLRPQTAETWSIGTDIEPPFIPGLRLSATYYNIKYENIIQQVPFVDSNLFLSTFANLAFIQDPSQAQIDAALAEAAIINGTPCGALNALDTCVYAIQDVRKRNLGGFKTDGIDIGVNYQTPTSFGGIDFSVNGTYIFNIKDAPQTGDPFIKRRGNFSEFKLRSTVGADIGDLRAQVAWNHSQGYDLLVPAGLNGQTSVGDYNTFDLFFKYKLPFEGKLEGSAITLGVNNVFDQEPPLFTGGDLVLAQRGFRNGNTVGRLFQIGVTARYR